MNTLNILIATFSILIGIMIYMSFSLYQIKKLSNKKKSSLSDPRYFELKYQHQLFISVATIIVFLVSFFGWNSLEGIRNKLDEQMSQFDNKFKEKYKSLQVFQAKQDQLNSIIDSIENGITTEQNLISSSVDSIKYRLTNNSTKLNEFFTGAQNKMDSLSIDLSKLSDVIAKNPSMYIVKKKVAGLKHEINADTIFFKKCIPLKGRLPEFMTAPFIISIEGEEGVTGSISNVTKDFFRFTGSFFGNDKDSIFAYFMILEF